MLIRWRWFSLRPNSRRIEASRRRYLGCHEAPQSGRVGNSRYCQSVLALELFECRSGTRPHDAVDKADVVSFGLQGTLYGPEIVLRVLRPDGRQ